MMFKKDQQPVNDYAPKQRSNGEQLISASDAMVKYCEEVARHLEQMGDEIMKMAEEMVAECRQTAENLRQVGELEKQRTSSFYQRVRDAIASVQNTRRAFDMPHVSTKALPASADAVANALSVEVPVEEQDVEKG